MHPLVPVVILPTYVDYWDAPWSYDVFINDSRNKKFPCICIPKNLEEGLKTRKELYTLLHEFGHVHLRHMPGYPTDEQSILLREKGAWEYGIACLQKKYHSEYRQFAEECLETFKEVRTDA